jgi:hypothetical protein
MGELLLRVELVLQRVLQLFTLQLSTSTPSKNRTSETESHFQGSNLPKIFRRWLLGQLVQQQLDPAAQFQSGLGFQDLLQRENQLGVTGLPLSS